MDTQWDSIRTALAALRADLAECMADVAAMGVETIAGMVRAAHYVAQYGARFSAPSAPAPERIDFPTAVRPVRARATGGRRVGVPRGPLPIAA